MIRSTHACRTTGGLKYGCRDGDVEQSLQARHPDRISEHSHAGMVTVRLRASAELKAAASIENRVCRAILENRSKYSIRG